MSVVLPVPGHAELHLRTTSGRVEVSAEERDDVVIESGAPPDERIDADATGRIAFTSARHGSTALAVRCPAGSDVVVGTMSGNVELRGQFGDVRITTFSGDVAIDRADSVDVRSMSGTIQVERCAGACCLKTTSGRTTVGSAGDVRAATISGQIEVGKAAGDVRIRSASGKVELGTGGEGDVSVETMSGSVRVEVPHGVRPSTRLRSISGRPRSECEEGDDCRISIVSLSGKIEVIPT